MTDHEWDGSADAPAMLRFLAEYERPAWLARRARLFAAACCRRVWDRMPDRRSREAVEEAERAVGRQVRPSHLRALREAADDVWSARGYWDPYMEREYLWPVRVARTDLAPEAAAAARAAAGCADPDDPVRGAAGVVEALQGFVPAAELAGVLRDVCGNPFRRPAGRRWWSRDVRELARTLEDDRAFDRLPILGDALLDAGCEDEEMNRHCQSAGPHVLGCWVVDLALGRE